MAAALIAGPALALIGVVAVFFVLRRKSVEKRSMYSARRSQIEHKVRAARQRTLAPHGRAEKPAEASVAPGASPFDATASAPTAVYEPPAYQAPPVASPPPPMTPPPPAPQFAPEAAPSPPSPWEVGPTAPSPFAAPSGEPEPFMPITPETAAPAEAAPPAYEPAWTPSPAPLEPVGTSQYETSAPVAPPGPAEPAQPVSAPSGGASWSIVGDDKDTSISAEPEPKQKGKQKGGATGSWQLASGEAPGDEAEDAVKRPNANVAIAQYAVLVVGLVMVLIGVLIMIGSHPG